MSYWLNFDTGNLLIFCEIFATFARDKTFCKVSVTICTQNVSPNYKMLKF